MTTKIKNKLFLWLVIILLIGNVISISIFWLGSKKLLDTSKGTPKEFLIRELNFNKTQQEQLERLMLKHREETPVLRKNIKQAKKEFFDLLKSKNFSDSLVLSAAKSVSKHIEKLDLHTFYHFQKIRMLCTTDQQKKFDNIIHEITTMKPPARPLLESGDAPRNKENTQSSQ